MSDTRPDTLPTDDDRTVVAPRATQASRACPVCGTVNPMELLQKREYRCGKCNLELAHLDYAPNGALRGVFGWLLAPGDVVLDRYKIKSVLGKGGFGAAYLVDDLQLSGKRRALKEVPEMLFDEYETSLLSRLDHPAIPDIIERRTAGGMVYLSLKFGGSRTLGSERKQYPDKRVPMEKLFPWMRQLCEVLVYLHSQTPPIIHRDLKPDNVLLNEDERIMLVDFGIAKESVPEAMTRTLGRAATYGFSPPEQVMGTGTDERSDIYALGATFYALLTGQNPPPAHERVAGTELAPPSQFVPDLPLEVEDAILQALSLNIHQRQQSVKEFALCLGGVETGVPSQPITTGYPTGGRGTSPLGRTAPPTAARRTSPKPGATDTQRNNLLALAGILASLAAVGAGAYYWISREPAPVAKVAPPTDVAQPTTQPAVPTAQPADQATVPSPAQPAATPPPAQTPVAPPAQTEPPVTPPPTTTTTPAQPPTDTVPQTPAVKPPQPAISQEPPAAKPPKAKTPPPAVTKPQPKERPASPPPPKPKPVAKPKPAAPPRSAPKPSGGAAPSWTIIPGGSRQTD